MKQRVWALSDGMVPLPMAIHYQSQCGDGIVGWIPVFKTVSAAKAMGFKRERLEPLHIVATEKEASDDV